MCDFLVLMAKIPKRARTIIIIIVSSRGSFAQPSYGIQAQPGVTYSLARNSCLSTSMRLECAICGRGAEFPRASARRCLTFPHGVYSAHRFSSRSFSSPTRCTGFADSPRLTASCQGNCFIMGNCRPASIRFMVSVTRFSHCTGMNNTPFR